MCDVQQTRNITIKIPVHGKVILYSETPSINSSGVASIEYKMVVEFPKKKE